MKTKHVSISHVNIPSWEVRKEALDDMHTFHMQGSRELVTLNGCLVCGLGIPQTNTQDSLLLLTLGSYSVLHHPQQHDHATNRVTFTTANARCTTRECSVVFQWTDRDHGQTCQHPITCQALKRLHKKRLQLDIASARCLHRILSRLILQKLMPSS